MTPRRIWDLRREHRESGALHELFSIASFLDEHIFLTKTGELGSVLKINGVDYECLEPAVVDNCARRFEAALRTLTEEFRLYQYLLKHASPEIPFENCRESVVQRAVRERIEFLSARSLYSVEIYFVVLYQGWHSKAGGIDYWLRDPKAALAGAFSASRRVRLLDTDLTQSMAILRAKVASFQAQLKDLLHPEVLDKPRAFQFFLGLVNYQPHRREAKPKYDHWIDQQLAQSSLECHRDHLSLEDHCVKVLAVTEPPAQTFAHMFRRLAEVPCSATLVSEWKPVPNARIRQLIRSKRRHFHNSKTSLANYLDPAPVSERNLLVDDGDEALVRDLGHALRELAVEGNYFGEWSMVVILYDRDLGKLDRAAAECIKAFATQDATVIEERYNLLLAWLTALPGNHSYNVRRLYLLNTNCADLSFLYTLDPGELRNQHLNQEYLAVLETNHATPYYLNLHYQDNAHTAIFGATGSGKSFMLNFLLTHLQKYQPHTIIFDLGAGYENLTRLFSGSYMKVGLEHPGLKINPFALEPSKENLHFLASFVRVLIESSGVELSSEDEHDLTAQIASLYQIEPDLRRLGTLRNILNRRLSQALDRWVADGVYAAVFDHAEDNLSVSRFQAFDFEGMDQYPQVLEPLLFYILHRANASIHALEFSTQLKVFVLDEAWCFFRNPAIQRYIVEALKTWRKKNAAMILATQSGEDINHAELLPVVLESCATKMFLANPGMDRAAYRQRFHLNETEVNQIAHLVPKRQILIHRPDLSKVLNLYVNPQEYWLYTNSPFENARRREAFERFGFEEGLAILARESTA